MVSGKGDGSYTKRNSFSVYQRLHFNLGIFVRYCQAYFVLAETKVPILDVKVSSKSKYQRNIVLFRWVKQVELPVALYYSQEGQLVCAQVSAFAAQVLTIRKLSFLVKLRPAMPRVDASPCTTSLVVLPTNRPFSRPLLLFCLFIGLVGLFMSSLLDLDKKN